MAVRIKGGLVVPVMRNDGRAFERLRGVLATRGLPRRFRDVVDLVQYENETDGGKQHEMRAE